MLHIDRSTFSRRAALPMVAFAVAALALATAAYLTLSPRGTVSVGVGGPFTLVSGDGRTVTDRDYLGSAHLVFFGFTHCPDVCPTTLFQLSEMFRAMGDKGVENKGVGDKGRRARALFITVDPERDTPEIMKSYVSSFDDRIVGLTGDRPNIDQTIKEFRAYAKKVPLKDGDYTMEHTALVYLMDKEGRFVGSFNLDRPPEAAAKDFLARS